VAPTFAPCAIVTPQARVDNGRGEKTRCRPRVAIRHFSSHNASEQGKTPKLGKLQSFEFWAAGYVFVNRKSRKSLENQMNIIHIIPGAVRGT